MFLHVSGLHVYSRRFVPRDRSCKWMWSMDWGWFTNSKIYICDCAIKPSDTWNRRCCRRATQMASVAGEGGGAVVPTTTTASVRPPRSSALPVGAVERHSSSHIFSYIEYQGWVDPTRQSP